MGVGKWLENLVYTELKKSGFNQVFYGQTTHECDFIVHDERSAFAMQVCYQLDENNKKREIAGLKAAMKQFKLSEGVIITYDQEAIFEKHIIAMSFWQYFSGF